jgi:hypothetical protein
MILMDRIVAGALFFLGIAVAWKSIELPIGILPREGPGGGFLPFWLSVGISTLSAGVFIQSYFGGSSEEAAAGAADEETAAGEESTSSAPAISGFITWEGFVSILRVGVPALLMIFLTTTISIYFASAAFVFYCLYIVGRHGLRVSLSVALGVPVGIFLIFEKFLIIPLPKGVVEPLFYMEWDKLF